MESSYFLPRYRAPDGKVMEAHNMSSCWSWRKGVWRSSDFYSVSDFLNCVTQSPPNVGQLDTHTPEITTFTVLTQYGRRMPDARRCRDISREQMCENRWRNYYVSASPDKNNFEFF